MVAAEWTILALATIWASALTVALSVAWMWHRASTITPIHNRLSLLLVVALVFIAGAVAIALQVQASPSSTQLERIERRVDQLLERMPPRAPPSAELGRIEQKLGSLSEQLSQLRSRGATGPSSLVLGPGWGLAFGVLAILTIGFAIASWKSAPWSQRVINLAIAGSLSLASILTIKEMDFRLSETFELDHLFEVTIVPRSEPTRTQVPSAIDCMSSGRTLGPFVSGQPVHDGGDDEGIAQAIQIKRNLASAADGRELVALILIGSTDIRPFRQPGGNAELARQRAFAAHTWLERAYNNRAPSIVEMDSGVGLARWIHRINEEPSGREVMVCAAWASGP